MTRATSRLAWIKSSSALVLSVSLLAGLPMTSVSAQQASRPKVKANSAATRASVRTPQIARSLTEWHQAVQRLPRPAPGCYAGTFPRVEWKAVPCGVAPDYPIIPTRGGATHFIVGNGPNDFAAHPANPISGVEGQFLSVSGGITEQGPIANSGPQIANAYTLQINTDNFASSACAGSPNPDCKGWEQFVYENNNVSHRVFIQYWLIKYNATCPMGAGWTQFSFSGDPDIYCYQSTTPSSLAAGVPVSALSTVTFSGSASAGSDQVTIVAGPNMAMRVGVNAVHAAGAWSHAEFNIFGDGGNSMGGGQASFGANTTLGVRTTVHSGTTAAPGCELESFTGETNNLTLVGMAPIGIQPSPAIEFTQSNIPGTPAACMVAEGVGDTHLRTFGGLLYDFQATGDFILAQVGRDFMVQNRQISGAPNWPNAAVNTAVATQMGKTRIALCSPSARTVNINGDETAIPDQKTLALPGGVEVRRVGNVYLAIDGVGNSMRAELDGSYINVSVGLGRWPSAATGLLANARNNPSLIAARGGATLAAPFAFADLYGKYADSWRPAPGQSLLQVCGRAQEAGAPRATLTTRDLPPERARQAQTICRAAGVGDPALMEACIIDVVVLERKDAAKVFAGQRKPLVTGLIRGPVAGKR